MAAMNSSFSGGAVLTSRSVSGSCTSASVVVGDLSRTSVKCSAHLASCFASVVSSLPQLFIHNKRAGGHVVLAADELGDLVHLPLFSPVGGLVCLTCQVFRVDPLVSPCHPFHCPICFLVPLPVSLFEPL